MLWNVHFKRNVFLSSAKPRIQPAPSLLKALIGQTVTLPCVVQGEPSPEVSWFHNGLPVGTKNTTPLRIERASLGDQGTYQCVAKNSAGQKTLEIKLEILGEYLRFTSLIPACSMCEQAEINKTLLYCIQIYFESCLECRKEPFPPTCDIKIYTGRPRPFNPTPERLGGGGVQNYLAI